MESLKITQKKTEKEEREGNEEQMEQTENKFQYYAIYKSNHIDDQIKCKWSKHLPIKRQRLEDWIREKEDPAIPSLQNLTLNKKTQIG